MDYRVRPGEMQEDQVTAMLERYSSKWPTSLFMGAAIASIIGSMILKNQRKHQRCAVRWTMGRAVFDPGFVQQVGEAAWVGHEVAGAVMSPETRRNAKNR